MFLVFYCMPLLITVMLAHKYCYVKVNWDNYLLQICVFYRFCLSLTCTMYICFLQMCLPLTHIIPIYICFLQTLSVSNTY